MAGKMSVRGKTTRAKNVTKSTRCDLVFPVGRVTRYIKKGRYAGSVGVGAGIFTAAVLEYLTNEILMLAGNAATEHKKKTIVPRHLTLAIRNDEELAKLTCMVTIAEGGVLPNVHGFLFRNKTGKSIEKAITVK